VSAFGQSDLLCGKRTQGPLKTRRVVQLLGLALAICQRPKFANVGERSRQPAKTRARPVHEIRKKGPFPWMRLLFFVELRFHGGLDLLVERLIVLERFLGSVATLGQLGPFVIKPRTAFLDNLLLEGKIEQRSDR
jgi:hypothetical protein